MLPLSKPGKDTCMIDSFRPINNLVILEKIVEEWIKESLIEFLETNNILSKNHHGGRAAHSTITAKTQIDQKLHKNYENDKITAVLATDLSAAYDTVDHEILLKKLEHYGVRGGELELFKNYLKDRKQFVEVDTFRSPILDSPEASVIQGSKMSGLLYNLYTNEVPLLYKLVHNTWFEKITNTNKIFFKNIEHLTVLFVDDATSVITFPNTNQIQTYLESYYTLIEAFFFYKQTKNQC